MILAWVVAAHLGATALASDCKPVDAAAARRLLADKALKPDDDCSWNAILKALGSGEPQWLALSSELRAAADPSLRSELDLELADALTARPTEALDAIARLPAHALLKVCAALPPIEPGDYNPDDDREELQSRRDSLKEVKRPALKKARAQCAAAIDGAFERRYLGPLLKGVEKGNSRSLERLPGLVKELRPENLKRVWAALGQARARNPDGVRALLGRLPPAAASEICATPPETREACLKEIEPGPAR